MNNIKLKLNKIYKMWNLNSIKIKKINKFKSKIILIT